MIRRIMQILEGVISQSRGLEVDNTLRDLHNSSYHTIAKFNNCLIIHSVTLLLLLNHFFVTFIFIFAKKWGKGAKAPPPPVPPSVWSLEAGAFHQS